MKYSLSLALLLLCLLFYMPTCSFDNGFTYGQTSSSNTTCINCSVRDWMNDLQQEYAKINNQALKLAKAIAVLNSSNVTSSIISTRVAQLAKLNSALNSLNLELQIINNTCNSKGGPDCSIPSPIPIVTPNPLFTNETFYLSFDDGLIQDKYNKTFQTTGVTFTDTSPRKPGSGKYAVFDGSTSYLTSNQVFEFGTGYSISFWLRKRGVISEEIPWSFGSSLNAYGQLRGSLAVGDAIPYEVVNAVNTVIFAPKITANVWNHIAFVCRSASTEFYLNGNLTATANSAFGLRTGEPLVFGRFRNTIYNGKFYYFNGDMDEIRIFKTDLSAAQVKQVYDY